MISIQFAQSSSPEKGEHFLLTPFLAAQTLHPASRCLSFTCAAAEFLAGFQPLFLQQQNQSHPRPGGQDRPQCFLPMLDSGFKSLYLEHGNEDRTERNEKNKNAHNVLLTALGS